MPTASERPHTFAEEVREYLQEDLECSEAVFVDAKDTAFTVDDAYDNDENEIISLSYYTPTSVIHMSIPLDTAVNLAAAIEQAAIRARAGTEGLDKEDEDVNRNNY